MAAHLHHFISVTAAFCPCSHFCYLKLGGLHRGLPREAPHNWVFLLLQANGPVLEPVSLPQ